MFNDYLTVSFAIHQVDLYHGNTDTILIFNAFEFKAYC